MEEKLPRRQGSQSMCEQDLEVLVQVLEVGTWGPPVSSRAALRHQQEGECPAASKEGSDQGHRGGIPMVTFHTHYNYSRSDVHTVSRIRP